VIFSLVLIGTGAGGEQEHFGYALILIEQLGESTTFTDLAESALQVDFEQLEELIPENQPIAKLLRNNFSEEVSASRKEPIVNLAEIYTNHFREPKLRQVVNFHSSPTGKKWLHMGNRLQSEVDTAECE